MGKRPRIKPDIGIVIVSSDPLAFTKNKCSENARMVHTKAESIEFDIWFDKHYYIREQHGDEDGKRDGIDANSVQNLIVNAAKYLLYYSIRVPSFSFVNFEVLLRNQRVILTSETENGENLNIVVEYHYLSLNRYEVTLITALTTNLFHFNDGQFQIKIYLDGTSSLYRKEKGKIKTIAEYLLQ